MLQQQDSIPHHVPQPPAPAEGEAEEAAATEALPQADDEEQAPDEEPQAAEAPAYHSLRPLPADATTAQRDSAIEQAFFPDKKLDQLQKQAADSVAAPYLKSDTAGMSLIDLYRKTFFSKDSLFNERVAARSGVAGDPMPYSIRTDDILTALLLGSLVLMLLAFSRTSHFLLRQARDFFRPPHRENVFDLPETQGEVRLQFFLVMLTCLLWALLCFIYTYERVADTFILSSQYLLILIFAGCFAAYFVLKALLYAAVDGVFFGKEKNQQFLKSQLYLTAMQGVALFPLVMLESYFNFSVESSLIYAAAVVILAKILTFYKAFVIFFRQSAAFVQIFLYFCALEIVPLLSLAGILALIVDHLKINY